MLRRSRRPRLPRVVVRVAALAAVLSSGCTAIRSESGRADELPVFDPRLYDAAWRPDLEIEVGERDVLEAVDGASVLRVRYSFVSFRGYPAPEDVRRSTGTLFVPLDRGGAPRTSWPDAALLTEFPPGASVTGFDVLAELGVAPAARLGVPAAVVDLRGPVVRDLPRFENPDGPDRAAFRNEEQFALAMLRSYAETGDPTLLWEQRLGDAWLRAVRATEVVVRQELGTRACDFVLAGERWGALGAAQAGAVDGGIRGLVVCGWPLDWMDATFVGWRRWERDAGYAPLAKVQPSAWEDSRQVLSFLSSSWGNPDPGCPACEGTGAKWLAQFDLSRLRRGPLAGIPMLLLVGDSDPDEPIDLEARASAPLELLAALPPPAGAPPSVSRGPFASPGALPFDDLRYLPDAPSTLANGDAGEAVLAWLQHLGGFRDVPRLRVEEEVVEGHVQLTVIVTEGNAVVTGVEVRTLDIGELDGSDFKSTLHRERPVPLPWRRVEPLYAGHDRTTHGAFSTARWKGFFPHDPDRNQAYYVTVRTRVGSLSTSHSLPIRVLWHLGDPALGPARL